jgi:hypothetical protein
VSGLAVLTAVHVEPIDFLAVVGTSAVAGTISALVTGRGLLLPAVVVELLLGVLIGPQVLGLDVSEFIEFFTSLGLGMLFFFAGYEIDLHRIAGLPLRLAALGWAISLWPTRSGASWRQRGSCSRSSIRARPSPTPRSGR